jgi:energy-coupling factor transporter ATP-binding protein EcfA2
LDKIIHKIAFCGKMGSGKSTAAIALTGLMTDKYGYQDLKAWVIAFANPLKMSAMAFKVEENEEKPRVFLQRLADLARREFGEDIMIRILQKSVNHAIYEAAPQIPHSHILIMCDDLRFKDEAEALKQMGFVLVRIEANDEIRKQRLGDAYTNVTHRSEMELDLFEPDFVVRNDTNEPQAHMFTENLKEAFEQHGLL